MHSVPRYLVDTNVLLRLLTGEPEPHAAAARNLFFQAYAGEVILDISPVVVAEAFYTLISFYKIERNVAAEQLSLMLQQRGVKLRDANQVLATLARLQTTSIGFVDAYLAAGSLEEGVPVASFDRDLDKFKGVRRHEPKR